VSNRRELRRDAKACTVIAALLMLAAIWSNDDIDLTMCLALTAIVFAVLAVIALLASIPWGS